MSDSHVGFPLVPTPATIAEYLVAAGLINALHLWPKLMVKGGLTSKRKMSP